MFFSALSLGLNAVSVTLQLSGYVVSGLWTAGCAAYSWARPPAETQEQRIDRLLRGLEAYNQKMLSKHAAV